MSPLISVIICTRNRAAHLDRALKSLVAQDADSNIFEIFVVDNNSRDETRTIAMAYCKGHGHVRYVYEDRVGLSHARNRGASEAHGTYLAYLDDDAKVLPGWVSAIAHIANNVNCAAFGGPLYPFYAVRKPNWFKDEYGTYTHGRTACQLSTSEYLFGGNFVIPRQAVIDVGGFRAEFGMRGGRMGYGEETDLFRRIKQRNPEAVFYYDPSVYALHLVPKHKMSWGWILKHRFIDGYYAHRVFMGASEDDATIKQLCRQTFWQMKALVHDIINGIWYRDRVNYPHWQNYLYEEGLTRLKAMGASCGRIVHVARGRRMTTRCIQNGARAEKIGHNQHHSD